VILRLALAESRAAPQNLQGNVRDRLCWTRVLPFDQAAAQFYAEIAATRRRAGRPITRFDAQIAAIARSRDAGLATRNVADFEGSGIGAVDPWQG
jgi:predicted nucleic acid-binding protein